MFDERGGETRTAALNASGNFVRASTRGLTAACEDVESPRWHGFSASLVSAHGADSFPITSFTWIYFPNKASDATRTAAFGELLSWIYSDGQAFVEKEGYAQLPAPLLTEVKKKLSEQHLGR